MSDVSALNVAEQNFFLFSDSQPSFLHITHTTGGTPGHAIKMLRACN